MEIAVTSGVIATLLAEAGKAGRAECCGLLLGQAGRIEEVRPADNVADDPTRHFEIDPLALLQAHKAERAGGPQLIGYYHSHPIGHPVPSATDCEHASGDDRVWAIIAGGQVAFWRDGDGGFAEVKVGKVD
ncbi:MAG: M67 family metallopeptidase [Sphingomonadaceae bacterium]|nr:M67 family metallopeptidase [Sphingomonadaceae bacterium]